MHRLLTAALTCVVAAGLAVGAGFGIVAALNATPEQPNVPLVHFHSSPDEVPGLTEGLPSASPSDSPSAPGTPADEESPDASPGDTGDTGNASPAPEQSGEPSGSPAPGD